VEREPDDPIYEHCKKYIDIQFKSFKKDLKQQQESLLQTQKDLARFIIVSLTRIAKDTIHKHVPDVSETVVVQLLADASAATANANHSSEPLSIAFDFQKKSNRLLADLGVQMLDII
jgi:hypothetical protein